MQWSLPNDQTIRNWKAIVVLQQIHNVHYKRLLILIHFATELRTTIIIAGETFNTDIPLKMPFLITSSSLLQRASAPWQGRQSNKYLITGVSSTGITKEINSITRPRLVPTIALVTNYTRSCSMRNSLSVCERRRILIPASGGVVGFCGCSIEFMIHSLTQFALHCE